VEENIIQSNVDNLELYSSKSAFTLSMKIDDFESDKEEKKFITCVERLVRSSVEYKYWKQYIIEVLGMNHCVLTHEVSDECTIEVHHHVPSLFTVVKGVINEQINKNNSFTSFDISSMVMELHFTNQIGYVTLLKSLHEKFHNGYLDIPMKFINGNYDSFIQRFGSFIDGDDMSTIQSRLNITESNCHWLKNTYIGVDSA